MLRIDRARARVVAVLVLLIVAAVALHGHLPGGHAVVRDWPGSLGLWIAPVLILAASMTVVAIGVVTQSHRPSATVAVCGACGVVFTEALAFLLLDHDVLPLVSGIAGTLALLAVRWRLAHRSNPGPVVASDDDRTPLSRWLDRTTSQISWADSSRADWDRRVRPMLARQFELAVRQPRSRDQKAFDATGRVHFGDELWAWVDPENISRTGTRENGPGRAVLTDIIERLERL